MALSLGFASPLSVPGAVKGMRTQTRSTPLCGLDQSKSVKKIALPQDYAASAANLKPSSPFFNVLSPDARKVDAPPRPPEHWGVPIIGHVAEHWLGGRAAKRAQKYDGIYRTSIQLGPMNVVTNYGAIQDILGHSKVFESAAPESVKALFGANSQVFRDGPSLAELRTMLTRSFAPSVFPLLFPSFRARAEMTWVTVASNVRRDGSVKLYPVFRRHCLSQIAMMTTGLDMNDALASILLDKFKKAASAVFGLPFGPVWNTGVTARDELMNFFLWI